LETTTWLHAEDLRKQGSHVQPLLAAKLDS